MRTNDDHDQDQDASEVRKGHSGHNHRKSFNVHHKKAAHDGKRSNTSERKGRNSERQSDRPMNVLMILVDDLRPQFHWNRLYEPFSKPKMFTPNIDALAGRSLVLTRAYAQYSLCGPSRASLMTGRRPDVTRVYNNTAYWRHVGHNFTSIPQYFREHGYHTVGIGKVFHMGVEGNQGSLDNQDDAFSWSEPFLHPQITNKYKTDTYNWAKVPDNDTLVDDVTTTRALERLRRFSKRENKSPPFFMAVGFHKPHIAHACPHKFFNHYKLETVKFLSNKSWQQPEYDPYTGMVAFMDGISNEELGYIPEITMKQLRRAYFSCISYVDYLVGKLLSGLKVNDMDKSTTVVFLSDHGLHLGDNSHYGKYTNQEMATHVPLMIRIPGKTDHGMKSESLAELIDLFPTLVEATGNKPLERCPPNSEHILDCTDGQSLFGLVGGSTHVHQKQAVFSQVDRGPLIREYAIRTASHRYISSLVGNADKKWCVHATKWSRDSDKLYDLEADLAEATNVVRNSTYAETLSELRRQLHEHVFTHNC